MKSIFSSLLDPVLFLKGKAVLGICQVISESLLNLDELLNLVPLLVEFFYLVLESHDLSLVGRNYLLDFLILKRR